jgi:DNA-binding YbaB/EbfC family protein
MINPLKMAEMLSQANKMQEEMQRKLAQTVVEGSSGGGAVTVTMNGKKELLKIKIDPAAVTSLSGPNPDVEMLEALIVGAVNEAGHKADDAIQSSVKGALGGLNLNIPGLG